jgi:hypothetical protein
MEAEADCAQTLPVEAKTDTNNADANLKERMGKLLICEAVTTQILLSRNKANGETLGT